MGWRQVHLPGGGTGPGGPGIADAFVLRFSFPDANGEPVDALAVAMVFPDTIAGQDETVVIRFVLPDTVPLTSDLLTRLQIAIDDSIPAITDSASFNVRASFAEANNPITDGLGLLILGLGDSNTAPTDGRSAQVLWVAGATTAVSSGAQAWATPANAQGGVDGTLATATDNNALAAVNASLNLDPYPDPPATVRSLAIVRVRLLLYASGTSGTLGLPTRTAKYRLGTGAYTDLESWTAAHNDLTIPRAYDITAARAWTWADIDAINTQATFASALAATQNNFAIDAFLIEVTATLTL